MEASCACPVPLSVQLICQDDRGTPLTLHSFFFPILYFFPSSSTCPVAPSCLPAHRASILFRAFLFVDKNLYLFTRHCFFTQQHISRVPLLPSPQLPSPPTRDSCPLVALKTGPPQSGTAETLGMPLQSSHSGRPGPQEAHQHSRPPVDKRCVST